VCVCVCVADSGVRDCPAPFQFSQCPIFYTAIEGMNAEGGLREAGVCACACVRTALTLPVTVLRKATQWMCEDVVQQATVIKIY
jgi:hypothetical protein